jgi:hypothetical protein
MNVEVKYGDFVTWIHGRSVGRSGRESGIFADRSLLRKSTDYQIR